MLTGILRRVSDQLQRDKDPPVSPWEPTVLGFSFLSLLRSLGVAASGFSEVRLRGRQRCQLIGLFLTSSARKVILGAAFFCGGPQDLEEGSGFPISRHSCHWPSSGSAF